MTKSVLVSFEEITNLIKESIGKKLILPRKSFGNIFNINETVKENPLLEGIFRTYKPEKVLKYLEKRYGDAAIVNVFDGDNEEKIFLIKTSDVDYNQNIIDKDMALCGYFPSYVEKNNGQRTIQYEPRHQNATKTNRVKKILNIGLTPKTHNKKFNYPDRVYFFLNEPSYDEWIDIIEEFYSAELKAYKMRQTNNLPYEGSYTVLSIDTEKIKNTDFFYDPNAENCVYTYDNIPPEAIEVVCEIEQEYLK